MSQQKAMFDVLKQKSMKKKLPLMKRFKMNFLIPALVLSIYSLSANASNFRHSEPILPNHLEILTTAPTGTGSWILDETINNVECYYKIETCNGATTVFLKFNNKNAGNVKITWEEIFATQHEKAAPGFVGKKELLLLPGSTDDYDCSGLNALLIIRSAQISPAYPVEVSQFKFSNITVTNP